MSDYNYNLNTCCSTGICASDGTCCSSENPLDANGNPIPVNEKCDADGDGSACGTWSCATGTWTCINDNPNNYYLTGEYGTPQMSFPIIPSKAVGLKSIKMTKIDMPESTAIKVIKFYNSTESISVQHENTATGAIENSDYILSTPVYGKYFAVDFLFNSSKDRLHTPNLQELTITTTPRITTFTQGPTVGKCSPTSVVYTCINVSTEYFGTQGPVEGAIGPCDAYHTIVDTIPYYAQNYTKVMAMLNATTYTENNYTDNIMYVPSSVCSS